MSWGNQMDEDMAFALALSMSMDEQSGGGGGGGDVVRGGQRTFSSSSQDPRSGHLVDQASTKVKEYINLQGQSISVCSGDMTKEKVDVVVNAANKQLDHASGLAGALVKKGGEIIQDESDIWIAEYGQVAEGKVAVTGPGLLPCKKIVHAVGPTWRGGDEDEIGKLRSCVLESLKQTETLKMSSISIPAISSGIFGFPKVLCADVLFQTALDYFKTNPQFVKEVRFTNFDKDTVRIFTEEFVKRFDTSKTGDSVIREKAAPAPTSAPTTSSTTATVTTTTPSVQENVAPQENKQ
eukprot:TRINITY_DN5750_c0_g1_i1.p1 TRINITY_DN5750_c0_g1~~TRINITY_DN5750_c0_g1_i1.p1  ORF type:complete len:306 (+),score=90.08 TRINITY_DN5750_c0_g1_i1:39-920(+)